jgi:hypothetical protein
MKNLSFFFTRTHAQHAVLCAIVTLGLAACGADEASSASGAAVADATPPGGSQPPTDPSPPGAGTPVTGAGTAPTIAGTPTAALDAGSAYSFVPTATRPSGTSLIFSIANMPVWANFDTATGALTGTPLAANVGTYTKIVVSVSDGKATAALPAFTVTVDQFSNGTATVDWLPPTENSDGTVLTNLAGYHLYYGTSAGNLTQKVLVTNPGLSAYTVSNLSPGTWYFAVSSYSSTGVEGARSGMVSATL